MKRYRIWIQAEYEFPDDTELVRVFGGDAIRVGAHVVQPTLTFHQLKKNTDVFSAWVDADDEVYDSVFAGEKRLAIDVVKCEGVT